MGQAPLYVLDTPNQDRGLSANLWRQQLQRYVSNDPGYGVRFQDDFTEFVDGISGTTTATQNARWKAIEADTTGGTYSIANVAGEPDGVGRFNSTGTSNHQGIEAQGAAYINTPKHSSDPRGPVVFQVRIDDTGDADTVFIGLTEAGDQFLSTASALPSDEDFIGFFTDDGFTTLTFYSTNDNDGGTQVQKTYEVTSLLEDSGAQVIGFRVNRDGTAEIEVNGTWVDGITSGVTPESVPIETLVPRVTATAGGGTTAPTVDLDSVDVFMAQN